MLEARFGRFVPSFLLRRLMFVETEIERAVARFASELPESALVLDAGSGEGRYAQLFAGQRFHLRLTHRWKREEQHRGNRSEPGSVTRH